MKLLEIYRTSKIKRKINKLNISLEELLMIQINLNKTKQVKHILDNYVVDFNYINDLEFDLLSLAVSKGNLEIINSLKENGFNISKKYRCEKKFVPVTYYVKDLNTLKYLEKYIEKQEITKSLESVIKTTIMNHDIELLDYILKNYNINLKKINYVIQDKKYNILNLTEEILQSMKNREYRKREMAFYISELLNGKRYKKIEKNAYEILNKIEEENMEIEKFYNYVKEQFGVKK